MDKAGAFRALNSAQGLRDAVALRPSDKQ